VPQIVRIPFASFGRGEYAIEVHTDIDDSEIAGCVESSGSAFDLRRRIC
jgi:hypothetical protein